MTSLLELAEIMIAAQVAWEERLKHDLERAAKIVEKEAKAEIGTYQGEAGPFVAWAELADSTITEKERLGYPEDPLIREGDLQASIQHRVEGNEAFIGSDLPEAEYQELGTSRIPPRSYLGGAAVRKGPKIAQILGEGFHASLVGKGVKGGAMDI